jgi:ribonuclease BN (tRNA processing enzyme)
VKTLLLSHFHRAVDPRAALASAKKHFSGRVLAARDHLKIEVGG